MNIRIIVQREDNPEYYGIVEEYNKLVEKWNLLMDSLQKFKIPKFVLFGTKQKLSTIGRQILDFDKKFISWKGRALKFLIAPSFIIGGEASQVGYLHYTAFLRDVVRRGEDDMRTLINSHNSLYSGFENRKNIVVGVIFFAFGCILQMLSWFIEGNFYVIL